MKTAIFQSNYIPWKGYFDIIASVEVFVLYDDMQFTKSDWRNRNLIKTPRGLQWLTIPVNVRDLFNQKIRDTKIADRNWNKRHWAILEENYKNALCFEEVSDWLKPLYLHCKLDFLTDINVLFLQSVMDYLSIKTPLRMSSEFILEEDRTERLAGICQQLDADHYITGPAAKAYMNESVFAKKGIQVSYFDYSDYPEYRQLFPPFVHGVSILDLLFNLGKESKLKMKMNG